MYNVNRRSVVLGACAAITFPIESHASIVGPEYFGEWEAVDLKTNTVRQLERQTPNAKVRSKGFGGMMLGKAESFYEIPGAASPVRFRSSSQIGFIMRVASQREDPHNAIQFTHVEVHGGTRRMSHTEFHALGGGSKIDATTGPVPYNVRKYGTEFFIVTPSGALNAGEYLLSFNGVEDGFFFGIDS